MSPGGAVASIGKLKTRFQTKHCNDPLMAKAFVPYDPVKIQTIGSFAKASEM